MDTPLICASCSNSGTLRCTGCKGAEPETVYCGADCQSKDWKTHRTFCGKKVYTFELTLIGSDDPVISRTFDVPSWFTFYQLHRTVQYAMAWTDSHLHDFIFESAPPQTGRNTFSAREELLRISSKDDIDDGMYSFGPPKKDEAKVKLSDVYESTGRLYSVVSPGGAPPALMYLYDFGDNWEHQLSFKGSKLARAARPIFTAATGCPPVEDSGSVCGWDVVKEAFCASHPDEEQQERISWTKMICGDAYSPFAEPDLASMNDKSRWERNMGF